MIGEQGRLVCKAGGWYHGYVVGEHGMSIGPYLLDQLRKLEHIVSQKRRIQVAAFVEHHAERPHVRCLVVSVVLDLDNQTAENYATAAHTCTTAAFIQIEPGSIYSH